MVVEMILTNEQAELALFKLAKETGKFGLPMSLVLKPKIQEAFQRGIDKDWFTFVDLVTIAALPEHPPVRIFKLTQAGLDRKKFLETVIH